MGQLLKLSGSPTSHNEEWVDKKGANAFLARRDGD